MATQATKIQLARKKVDNLEKAFNAINNDNTADGPGSWEVNLYMRALVKAQVELAALTGKPRGG